MQSLADGAGDWLEICQYPVSVNQTRRIEDQLSSRSEGRLAIVVCFARGSELRVRSEPWSDVPGVAISAIAKSGPRPTKSRSDKRGPHQRPAKAFRLRSARWRSDTPRDIGRYRSSLVTPVGRGEPRLLGAPESRRLTA
jgi:hypothetical protein